VRGHEGVATQAQRRVEHGVAGAELGLRDEGVCLALGRAKDAKVRHADAGAVGAAVPVQVSSPRGEHEHRRAVRVRQELNERFPTAGLRAKSEALRKLARLGRVAARSRRGEGVPAERSPGAREA